MDTAIRFVLISVLMGATGQVLLKKGMTILGPLSLSLTSQILRENLWRIATNPYVIVGVAIYAGATIFWLFALSRLDLSYAYPFVSLSYVAMLLASWLLLNESITPLRLLGTFVVCMGVLIVARS